MPKSPRPQEAAPPTFPDLGLSPAICSTLERLGYAQPTPVQASAIPPLLEGRDLIGQAQTGTGKTAAFALPLLERLDVRAGHVQVLVLTPTRELALQVSDAIQSYARNAGRVGVAAVYGGAPMGAQIRMLERGSQVVVGTPGRVTDLMRRGCLVIDQLRMLVLDEADEMLRMGFIEEVEWILSHTPAERQVALFSATLPPEIQRIAKRHTRKPAHVEIANKALTLPNIEQCYWLVKGLHKLDALTRILETEPLEAAIIFTRTKAGCAELGDHLARRGFKAEALHGDMGQAARELAVKRLKSHQIDVIVATDVAARGLDIERVSHVVNYDIPTDVESYVHRIGRTGRAGSAGKAILFVSPRERFMLKKIERFTKQPIPPLTLATHADVVHRRAQALKAQIADAARGADLEAYQRVVIELISEGELDVSDIAAAALKLAQREKPLERKDELRVEPEKADRGRARPRSDRPARFAKKSKTQRDRGPGKKPYKARPGQAQEKREASEGEAARAGRARTPYGAKPGSGTKKGAKGPWKKAGQHPKARHPKRRAADAHSAG